MTVANSDRSKSVVSVLSRENLVEVVRALRSPSEEAPSWNVVEALELLIDSGNFLLARDLASQVALMVQGDGRDRLFRAYEALCQLMVYGGQTSAIQTLESLYIEIHHKRHSLSDRARVALILGRALSVCVAMGSLPESALLRARQVLGIELQRCAAEGAIELQSVIALELAKSYLHAPSSDPHAAFGIMQVLRNDARLTSVCPALAFDISRVIFQIQRVLTPDSVDENSLRQEAMALGGVARGLAELVIARRDPAACEDALTRAEHLFQDNEFLAGSFEALFLLGSTALDRGYNSVAERHLSIALRVAERGGFLHGKLLARAGLFQAALITGGNDEAKLRCDALSEALASEVGLGSMGLNVAAAQQITGDISGALATADQCEKLFEKLGMVNSQSQAASSAGSCHARLGAWERACTAWSRAIQLDERRNAFCQASERRALLVQALVMKDMTKHGSISSTTTRKCEATLARAHQSLAPFGDSPEAHRVGARLHVIEAQLNVMLKRNVSALKHTARARECFDRLGLEHDVALVDALTGLAMIEVGKGGMSEMFEEAALTLQRALQFFASGDVAVVRWKILYYLSLSALLNSQHKTSPVDQRKWRDLACVWLRDAVREVDRLANGPIGLGDATPEGDFSPGLKVTSLDVLKKALGMSAGKRRQSTAQLESEDPILH